MDIGATAIKAALVNLRGELIEDFHETSPRTPAALHDFVHTVLKRGNAQLCGIGVGCKGVFVLRWRVPRFRQVEYLPAREGSAGRHGQRTPRETRVPMSRKRMMETRSALNTKPRAPIPAGKPSE